MASSAVSINANIAFMMVPPIGIKSGMGANPLPFGLVPRKSLRFHFRDIEGW